MTSSMHLPRSHLLASRPGPPSRTCRFCFKSFSKAEHLSRHERSHTKERPFRCKRCGKCYSRNDTLIRHGKVHNKGNVDIKISTERDALPTSGGLNAAAPTFVDLQVLAEPGQGIFKSANSLVDGSNDVSAIDPNLKNDQHGQTTDLMMDNFLSNRQLDESIHNAPQNLHDGSFSFFAQPELCDIEAESHYPSWHLEDDFDLQAFNNSLLAPVPVEESISRVASSEGQDCLVATPRADPYTPIANLMDFNKTSRKNDSPSHSVAPTAPTATSSANEVGDQYHDDFANRIGPRWKEDPPPSTDFIMYDLGKFDSCLPSVSEPGTPTLFHQVLPNFPYPPCTYFSSQ